MTISYGPSLVTNGLVMYLDAANPRSYPGSGTTWYDISGGGINLTTSGGNGNGNFPTYQSNTFSFASPNALYNSVNQTNLNITNNITIASWVNQTNLVTYGGIIVFGTGSAEQYSLNSDATNGFSFGTNWPGTWYLTYPTGTLAKATGTWIYVCVSFASGTTTWYINGTLNTTVSQGINSLTLVSGGYVGVGDNFPGGQEYFNGLISTIKVYNRVLSSAEITQNFKAHRGRYGI